MQKKIVSDLKNKDLLSHLEVYRKSATSAQTDSRITTNGLLYTGFLKVNVNVFHMTYVNAKSA